MKRKIIIVLIMPFLACACKPAKLVTRSPQISALPNTEQGTIFLRASGVGTTNQFAYDDAIYNAFSTLIFQGVPESIQSTPMVPPEDAARVKPQVDKCLRDINCYRNFITQGYQNPSGVMQVKKAEYNAIVEIKINIRSLRSYLEQNNIIRKFGL